MLVTVMDLDGNIEPLNNHQRLEITEEVNGAFSLVVTSFFVPNNPGYTLLEEESIISVDGYDFRVKKIRTNKNKREVVALSTFFDLIGHRQDLIYGGTRTHTEFLTFIFQDSGWTFSTSINDSRFIPNFGEGNAIELITALNAAFECEYKIMPNNHVHFEYEVGGDNDAQYRHSHNIKKLDHDVETYNLRTQITGIRPPSEAVEGKVGVDPRQEHPGFEITYTSPFAEKYGIKKADPVTNTDVQTEEEMVEFLKSELTDYPETSIELDTIELTNKEIGERVWLIYEPIQLADGTYMEFQTRVLKKVSTVRGNKIVTKSVVIGNAMPKTLSDRLADVKVEVGKNAIWTRSRIEQTNEQITLAVERFTGEILEAYSLIELTADSIRSEVDSKVTDINGQITLANSSITQLSNQITSVVNTTIPGIDGRLNTAESTITQQSNLIASKVSQADYNGVMMMSLIEQTPSSLKFSASKINLVGAVTVLSDISGDLGTITAGNIRIGTDLYIGNNIRMGHNQGSGSTRHIHLAEGSIISSGIGAEMNLSASRLNVIDGDINLGYWNSTTNFQGTVNFGAANVVGLNAVAKFG